MIQDRLTAKFLSAKTATRRLLKRSPQKTPALKANQPTAVDVYSRGRRLSASVWI